MSCESFLDHAAGFLDGSLTRADRDAVGMHLAGCADCRALLAALQAPDDPGLADAILARTSGAACESARSRLCDRVDATLGGFDAELVDGHLRHCPDCAALAQALRTLREELPHLAAVDPGPGFVDAVLARTSRRQHSVPLATRWAAFASSLLERPRIALEGAFVAAVVLGLPLAATPAPLAVSPTDAIEDARIAMSDIEATVHVGARSAFATARAFVVSSSNHLREGTFARLGASEQQGGEAARKERR